MDPRLISEQADSDGHPQPPFHGWIEGTDQTLCGRKPLTGWYVAHDRSFPPDDNAPVCPVCMSHSNAAAHPDHGR